MRQNIQEIVTTSLRLAFPFQVVWLQRSHDLSTFSRRWISRSLFSDNFFGEVVEGSSFISSSSSLVFLQNRPLRLFKFFKKDFLDRLPFFLSVVFLGPPTNRPFLALINGDKWILFHKITIWKIILKKPFLSKNNISNTFATAYKMRLKVLRLTDNSQRPRRFLIYRYFWRKRICIFSVLLGNSQFQILHFEYLIHRSFIVLLIGIFFWQDIVLIWVRRIWWIVITVIVW